MNVVMIGTGDIAYSHGRAIVKLGGKVIAAFDVNQKGLEKYIVGEEGETLRGICQRFAVQERSVRKLNGLGDGYVPREGDELKLRK